MITITNDLIAMLAPNAAAIANAKKISAKGGFVKLGLSDDSTFMMGECSGSGKSNYITSVDFILVDQPVFRCTCPSRQFPCKHGLALLFESIAEKSFENCEIPADIIDKRNKQDARREKQASAEPPKVNKAALSKKLKKQLEGLDLAEQCMKDMLNAGLGTLSGNSLKGYSDLAKQLGDYYLPGPQTLIKRILIEIEAIKEEPDQSTSHYRNAVQYLVQLQAVIKKARDFLGKKLDTDQIEVEESMLYENLGNVWNSAQLKQLGLSREDCELIQLSFNIYHDEAREELVDRGYWMDLATGEISKTIQYRPIRALKHVKQEDSCFEVVQVRELYAYPGEMNKRIRWDNFTMRDSLDNDIKQIRQYAQPDIPTTVKLVKNQIKNTLSEKSVAALLSYQRIGRIGDEYVLEDLLGNTILLKDCPDQSQGETVKLFADLPSRDSLENQVIFGAFFYDPSTRRIALQPLSIITEDQIIRMSY